MYKTASEIADMVLAKLAEEPMRGSMWREDIMEPRASIARNLQYASQLANRSGLTPPEEASAPGPQRGQRMYNPPPGQERRGLARQNYSGQAPTPRAEHAAQPQGSTEEVPMNISPEQAERIRAYLGALEADPSINPQLWEQFQAARAQDNARQRSQPSPSPVGPEGGSYSGKVR